MLRNEQIKKLAAEGKSANQIAEMLNIKPVTVYAGIHYQATMKRRLERVKRPYLKEWMQTRKCSSKELIEKMGGKYDIHTRQKIFGERPFTEEDATKLVKITGLSYEELFTIRSDS